jgi:hypothetical protein
MRAATGDDLESKPTDGGLDYLTGALGPAGRTGTGTAPGARHRASSEAAASVGWVGGLHYTATSGILGSQALASCTLRLVS